MARNQYWTDTNAAQEQSYSWWRYPASAVTFAPATVSTYEAAGTASGTHDYLASIEMVTVKLRSDATYNFYSTGAYKQRLTIFDSSGYLLNVKRDETGSIASINQDDRIISFKPDTTGTYYVRLDNSSSSNMASWNLSVTEDIGSDSRNTPGLIIDSGRPIYRFFNRSTGTHFFTSSEDERDNIRAGLNNFSYEGPAFNAATTASSDPITVYRFFNKRIGTHFFTSSTVERDNVIATSSDTYSFEGEAYKALSSDSSNPNAKSLYRFFNKTNGTHFYTSSDVERDSIIRNSSASYNFEGVAYKVLDSTIAPAGAPVVQAAAMPPQGEAALQSGVVDIAPADLTAAIGGLQAADPQPVAFGPGAFTGEATGGFAGLFPQQRSDWAAMFAA
ncbi:hypothetical protein ABNQ39_20245 [Azospirillum sp. A26]|uniref:hypothetical protein n=1 Tax=Azospirillum sp. A26 TaxID=3160607 RepID=UPI00366F2778